MGYEFFEEKIIFPSAPVLGINNDQSLTSCYISNKDYPGNESFIICLTDLWYFPMRS